MSDDEKNMNWTAEGSDAESFYCFKDMQSDDDSCVKGKTSLLPVEIKSGKLDYNT